MLLLRANPFSEEFPDRCDAQIHTEKEDRQADDDQECPEQETLQINGFERSQGEMEQHNKRCDRQHGLQDFP